jgi:hypothetical protein
MKKILTLLFAAVVLSGCTAFTAQQYAGMNTFDIELGEDGKPMSIKGRFGKESEDVSVSGDLKNGTFAYTAKGNRAFEAFKTRADAEKALYQMLTDLGPDVIKGVVDVVLGKIPGT